MRPPSNLLYNRMSLYEQIGTSPSAAFLQESKFIQRKNRMILIILQMSGASHTKNFAVRARFAKVYPEQSIKNIYGLLRKSRHAQPSG